MKTKKYSLHSIHYATLLLGLLVLCYASLTLAAPPPCGSKNNTCNVYITAKNNYSGNIHIAQCENCKGANVNPSGQVENVPMPIKPSPNNGLTMNYIVFMKHDNYPYSQICQFTVNYSNLSNVTISFDSTDGVTCKIWNANPKAIYDQANKLTNIYLSVQFTYTY